MSGEGPKNLRQGRVHSTGGTLACLEMQSRQARARLVAACPHNRSGAAQTACSGSAATAVSLQPSATGPRGQGPTGLPTWCQYVGRRVQKVFHDPATGVARPFDGWVDSVKVEGKMPL